ncbi:MAG TPA: transcriptional regulator [Firmicutes bacterium]|nr:transcriptional regulator [Bacillota bacterium]
MAFDFKKEYRELYQPGRRPSIIDVPRMNFLAVRGQGDPNQEDGEYAHAVTLLYAVAYTLRMSYKSDYRIEGFYEYVVPPLEGLWRQEGVKGVDYAHKERFQWISLIRLPDFIKEADFAWATTEAARKKKGDFSSVEFFPYHEGLCVQCMHLGPYEDEPATVAALERFMLENGYGPDFSEHRWHHEIYLTDPRKTDPAKLKTVIRHPVAPLGADR